MAEITNSINISDENISFIEPPKDEKQVSYENKKDLMIMLDSRDLDQLEIYAEYPDLVFTTPDQRTIIIEDVFIFNEETQKWESSEIPSILLEDDRVLSFTDDITNGEERIIIDLFGSPRRAQAFAVNPLGDIIDLAPTLLYTALEFPQDEDIEFNLLTSTFLSSAAEDIEIVNAAFNYSESTDIFQNLQSVLSTETTFASVQVEQPSFTLYSAGEPLIWSQTPSGWNVVDALGNLYASFTLDTDKSYSFTLFNSIDHSFTGGEVASVPFTFTAADTDGSTVTGTITANIFDSLPAAEPVEVTYLERSLFEEAQETGFGVLPNVDGGRIISLTISGLDESQQPFTISLTEDDKNDQGQFVIDDPRVGILVIDSSGGVSYALETPLVHNIDVETGDPSPSSFIIDYAFIDEDGDLVTEGNKLTINVLDTTPRLSSTPNIRVFDAIINDTSILPFEFVQGLQGAQDTDLTLISPLNGDDSGLKTNDGESIIWVVDNDNKQLYGVPESAFGSDNPAAIVTFSLIQNEQGQWAIQTVVNGNIFQEEDVSQHQVNLLIQVFDPVTSQSSTGTLPVTIVDTAPSLIAQQSDDTVITEDDVAAGTAEVTGSITVDYKLDTDDGQGKVPEITLDAQSDSGYTKDGIAILNEVTPTLITGKAGDTVIYEISIDETTGEWIFNLYETIDHDNNNDESLILAFDWIASDVDGDTVTGAIDITVTDGGPKFNFEAGDNVLTVSDVDENAQTAVEIPFISTDPSVEVSFDSAPTDTLEDENGNILTWEKTSDTLLELKDDQGTVVAYVELVEDGGSWEAKTVVIGNIKQEAGETEHLVDLPITLTDIDGDTDVANLQLKIIDSKPKLESSSSAANINEADLASGSVSKTGQVNIDFGSDMTGDIYDASGNDSGDLASSIELVLNGSDVDSGYTSGGEPIILNLVNGEIIGTADGETVFSVSIDNNGAWQYTQEKAIDHKDPSNNVLGLAFDFVAKDADLDTETGQITIIVNDDNPEFNFASGGNVLTVSDVDENTQTSAAIPFISSDAVTVSFDNAPSGTLEDEEGNVLTWSKTSDTLLELKDDQGTVVAYVELVEDGGSWEAKTVVIGNIKQEVGETEHLIDLPIILTDIDGDTDADNLQLKIIDSKPSLETSDLEGNVSEDDLTSGSITTGGQVNIDFGSDMTGDIYDASGNDTGDLVSSIELVLEGSNVDSGYSLDGKPIVLNLVNGEIVGTADGETVFTVSIDDNGAWQYTQEKAIDHQDANADSLDLSFDFIAKDADLDTVSGQITVTVTDDNPEFDFASGGNVLTVSDADENAQTSAAIPFISSGAVAVSFDNAPSGTLEDADGNILTWSKTSDTLLELKDSSDNVFAYVELVENSGSWEAKTVVIGNIKQEAGETEHLVDLPIILTDIDGDTDAADLQLKIIDSKPSLETSDLTADVDEIDLSSGSVTKTGQVNIDFGSDMTGDIYDASGNDIGDLASSIELVLNGSNVDSGYSSGGEPIILNLVNGEIIGTADGETVFSVSIDNNGAWQYTQEGAIDHQGANADSLDLNFDFIAKDADLDTVSGQITVTVTDDNPEFDFASDGNVLTVSDADENAQTSAAIPFISSDAVTVSFDNAPSGTLEDEEGNVLTWSKTSDTLLELKDSSDNVFAYVELVENSSGWEAKTVVSGNIKQEAGETEHLVDLPIILTDIDGDTNTTDLQLKIIDSKPSIETSDLTDNVDESDLSLGSVTKTGQVNIDFGTDGSGDIYDASGNDIGDLASSIELVLDGSNVDSGYTSGGEPIILNLVNGEIIGTADGETVFTVSIDETTGAWQYTQEGAIDHQGANADSLDLNFDFVAKDADLDTASGQITITVTDDDPEFDFSSGGKLLKLYDRDENSYKIIDIPFTSSDVPSATVSFGNAPSATFEDMDGNTLTWVKTSDTLLELKDDQGTVVAYVELVEDNGDWTAKSVIAGNIKQEAGKNNHTVNMQIVLTDVDGDTDTTNLRLRIIDSKPELEVSNLIAHMDEADLASGAITKTGQVNIDFGSDGSGDIYDASGNDSGDLASSIALVLNGSNVDSGYSSGGEPIILNLVNGEIIGTADGETVFTLSIDENTGAWDFTQEGAIDHEGANDDSLNLSFDFVAKDTDLDEASGQITIIIDDDVPEFDFIGDGNVLTTYDKDDNSQATIAIPFTSSSAVAVSFDGAPSGTLEDESGNVLTWVKTSDTLLELKDDQGTVVAYVELVEDSDSWEAKTVILGNIKQIEELTEHVVNLPIILTDVDGDTDTADLTLVIKDTKPVLETSILAGTTGENGLSSGSITTGGQINVNFLDDETGDIYDVAGNDIGDLAPSFEFILPSSNVDSGLTSYGEPILLNLVNGEIIGAADGEVVFTVSIDNTGAWQYIQEKPIDHEDENAGSLDLVFDFAAKDTDSDTTSGQITVTVSDDGPSFGFSSGGNIFTLYDKDHNSYESINIPFSSSDASSVTASFGNAPSDSFEDMDGNTLSWSKTSDTLLELKDSSDNVFAYVKLIKNGNDWEAKTVVLGNIKQAEGVTEHVVNLPVILTDVDGDTATTDLIWVLKDTKPVLEVSDLIGGVHESGLSSGSITTGGQANVNFIDDETGDIYDASGSDVGDLGASFELVLNGSNVDSNLTSNGERILLNLDSNGNIIGTKETSGETIFTVSIDNTGAWSFEQERAIDHQGANDDSLNLVFDFVAKDADLDTTSGQITVIVHDDIPDFGFNLEDNTITAYDVDTNSQETIDIPFTSSDPSSATVSFDNPPSSTLEDMDGNALSWVKTSDTLLELKDSNGNVAAYVEIIQNGNDWEAKTVVLGNIKQEEGITEHVVDLPIILTDVDSDIDTADLKWVIKDTKPVLETSVLEASVGEAALSSGSVTTGGQVNVNFFDDETGDSYDASGNDTGDLASSFALVLSGSDIDSGYTLDGEPILLNLVNGEIIGTADGETVFTVNIGNDGAWQYTQDKPMDHEGANDGSLDLVFDFVAKDADLDTVSGQITVTVNDDGPRFNLSAADKIITVYDQDENSQETIDLPFSSSDPASVAASFDGVPSDSFEDMDGNPLNWVKTSDTLLELKNSNGDVFAYIELIQNGDDWEAKTVFTGNIKQEEGVTEHTVDLPIMLTDADGDTDTTDLTLVIKDTAPVLEASTLTANIAESDLVSGSVTKIGQVNVNFVDNETGDVYDASGNDTGDLASSIALVLNGSDVDSGYRFGGEPILLNLNNDGDIVGTAGSETIFTLKMDESTGAWEFTQEQPIDHEGANDDSLDLVFDFVAKDADSDIADGQITITLDDDVSEFEFEDDNNVLTAYDADKNSQATIDIPFSASSASVTVSFDDAPSGTLEDMDGNTLSWSKTSDTLLELKDSSDNVFAYVELIQNGGNWEAKTVVIGNIKQEDEQTEHLIDLPIILTDIDGDTDTADLKLKIIDSKPSISDSSTLEASVDESDLSSGPVTVEGQVDADFGVDATGNIYDAAGNDMGDLTSSFGLVLSGSDVDSGFTSNGEAIILNLVNGEIIGTAGSETIFTVSIDETTGAWEFTQEGTIDHEDPNSDSLDLSFDFTANDADLDAASGQITVTVADDSPKFDNEPFELVIYDRDLNDTDNATIGIISVDPISAVEFDGLPTTSLIDNDGNLLTWQSVSPTTIALTDSSNQTILTVTLSEIGGNWSADAIIYGNIGQIAGDIDHNITLPIVAYDADNSLIEGDIDLTIIDSIPSLDVNQSSGLAGYVKEGDSTQTTGSIYIDYGSDQFGENPSLLSLTLPAPNTEINETYDGEKIKLNLSGDTITGTAKGKDIFTITLQDNGFWEFNLIEAIDHLQDDTLALGFNWEALDADGDYITGQIVVDVEDSDPNFVTLDTILNVADRDKDSTSAKRIEIASNDDIASLAFQNGLAATSLTDNDGNALNWVYVTSSSVALVAENTDQTVATIVLFNNAGDWYAEAVVYGDIKQSVGETDYVFDLPIVATDIDGDTAEEALTLIIEDSKPSLAAGGNSILTGSVEENDDMQATGNIDIDYGSDEFGENTPEVVFIVPTSNYDSGFTSDGNAILLNLDSNGDIIGAADGDTIFTLSLDDVTGDWEFNLLGTIDHNSSEDTLQLTFDWAAFDADLDDVSGTITIDVKDSKLQANDDTVEFSPRSSSSYDMDLAANDQLTEGAAITGFTIGGVDYTTAQLEGVGVMHNGGLLSLNGAVLTYTITDVAASNASDGDFEIKYVITDADGDISTASVTYDKKPLARDDMAKTASEQEVSGFHHVMLTVDLANSMDGAIPGTSGIRRIDMVVGALKNLIDKYVDLYGEENVDFIVAGFSDDAIQYYPAPGGISWGNAEVAKQFLEALDPDGGSNYFAAQNLIIDNFTNNRPDMPGQYDQYVSYFVSDGNPTGDSHKPDLNLWPASLDEENIQFYAVGAGSNVKIHDQDMNAMAPYDGKIVIVEDFFDLSDTLTSLISNAKAEASGNVFDGDDAAFDTADDDDFAGSSTKEITSLRYLDSSNIWQTVALISPVTVIALDTLSGDLSINLTTGDWTYLGPAPDSTINGVIEYTITNEFGESSTATLTIQAQGSDGSNGSNDPELDPNDVLYDDNIITSRTDDFFVTKQSLVYNDDGQSTKIDVKDSNQGGASAYGNAILIDPNRGFSEGIVITTSTDIPEKGLPLAREDLILDGRGSGFSDYAAAYLSDSLNLNGSHSIQTSKFVVDLKANETLRLDFDINNTAKVDYFLTIKNAETGDIIVNNQQLSDANSGVSTINTNITEDAVYTVEVTMERTSNGTTDGDFDVWVMIPVPADFDAFTYAREEDAAAPNEANVNFTFDAGILDGTSNADILISNDFDEIILGGAGDDWIEGRGGNDIIRGDAGKDIFAALDAYQDGLDLIADFDLDDDQINLSMLFENLGIAEDERKDHITLTQNNTALILQVKDEDYNVINDFRYTLADVDINDFIIDDHVILSGGF